MLSLQQWFAWDPVEPQGQLRVVIKFECIFSLYTFLDILPHYKHEDHFHYILYRGFRHNKKELRKSGHFPTVLLTLFWAMCSFFHEADEKAFRRMVDNVTYRKRCYHLCSLIHLIIGTGIRQRVFILPLTTYTPFI